MLDTNGNNIEFGDSTGAEVERLKFGAGDDISMYWDGTDGHIEVAGTLNIDGSGETLAKFIDDGAVELYHNASKKFETDADGVDVTGDLDVSGDITVTGDLTVNGTTTTVNSSTVTVDDPVFTLGGDSAPASDDNKDRGIEFRWHNGSAAKLGFFGFDDSTSKFTFIPDATNTSEVFSGTKGDINVGDVLSDTLTLDNGSNDWQFRVASNVLIISYGGTDKMKLDTSGNLTVTGNVTAFGTI